MQYTEQAAWIQKLHRAAGKGLIYSCEENFVKVTQFSPRRYFSCITPARVKAISNYINNKVLNLEAKNRKEDQARRSRQEALQISLSEANAKLDSLK